MKADIRTKLITAMFEALYTKGYHASNLNQILKDAGISKGGLYHHFSSKKELTLSAINEVLSQALDFLWNKPLDVNSDYIEALINTIESVEAFSQDSSLLFSVEFGCPLNNTISELSAIDKDFALLLQSLYNRWRERIELTLTQAKEAKETNREFNTTEEALFIIASIEGAISSAKLYNDINLYKQSITPLIRYIKTL